MLYIYALKLENGKYYIGKTRNPEFRINDHFESGGSFWTKRHKPIEVIELISGCDDYDEEKYVMKYMDKYGIVNVRGGSYSSINLDDMIIKDIQNRLNGINDRCFRCGGKGHFVGACNKVLTNDNIRIKIKMEHNISKDESIIPSKIIYNDEISTDCTIGTLYKISKYPDLYDLVKEIGCNIYYNLETALLLCNNILIYIPRLGIYCMFEDSKEISVLFGNEIYQIIRTEVLQKMVIFVNGDDHHIEEYVQSCINYFKCNVNHIDNGKWYEIMIDKLFYWDDMISEFKKFEDGMKSLNTNLISEIDVQLPNVIRNIAGDFTMSFVANENLRYNGNKKKINVENEINNKMNNDNDVIKNESIDDPRHNYVKNWIRNNPPKNKVKTTDYYNLYKKSLNEGEIGIKMSDFNNYIPSNLYKKCRMENINSDNMDETRMDNMKKWVNNNPPKNSMRSKLYYNEYKQSLNGSRPIDQGIFCDYVESLGYIKSRYDKYNRWDKKVNQEL